MDGLESWSRQRDEGEEEEEDEEEAVAETGEGKNDKVGRRGLERRRGVEGGGGKERLFGFTFDDDGPGSGPKVVEGQNASRKRELGRRGKRVRRRRTRLNY